MFSSPSSIHDGLKRALYWDLSDLAYVIRIIWQENMANNPLLHIMTLEYNIGICYMIVCLVF